MKETKINHRQRKRDHWQHEAHKNPTIERDFRDVRNEIKKTINKEKSTLKGDPTPLNKFFNEIAERPLRNNPTNDDVTMQYIDSLKNNTS